MTNSLINIAQVLSERVSNNKPTEKSALDKFSTLIQQLNN